jgi:hypothetical protein
MSRFANQIGGEIGEELLVAGKVIDAGLHAEDLANRDLFAISDPVNPGCERVVELELALIDQAKGRNGDKNRPLASAPSSRCQQCRMPV